MGTDGRDSRRDRTAGSRVQHPVRECAEGENHEFGSREAAEYVASLLEGLRLMAQRAQLPFLAYLIGVALEEANHEKQKADLTP